jgi:hypothetical protein
VGSGLDSIVEEVAVEDIPAPCHAVAVVLGSCTISLTASPSLKRASRVAASESLLERNASTSIAKLLATLVSRFLCSLNRSDLETPCLTSYWQDSCPYLHLVHEGRAPSHWKVRLVITHTVVFSYLRLLQSALKTRNRDA